MALCFSVGEHEVSLSSWNKVFLNEELSSRQMDASSHGTRRNIQFPISLICLTELRPLASGEAQLLAQEQLSSLVQTLIALALTKN